MAGRRHSTLLGENVFLHKQFITKGGKRRGIMVSLFRKVPFHSNLLLDTNQKLLVS